MAYSTDVDYNESSRQVFMCFDLYLDGPNAPPIIIDRNNYLIKCNLLDEATAGDTLFDAPSSNEFTVSLHSPEGIFNPANTQSPYFNKMKKGVKVVPKIKAKELDDWMPLGEFYVSEWTAPIVDKLADLVCNDKMYEIFNGQNVSYRPSVNVSLITFWNNLLQDLNIPLFVDPTLIAKIPIAYTIKDLKQTIHDLTISYICICNMDRMGKLSVINLRKSLTERITISDNDQIIKINAKISTTSAHEKAFLKWGIPLVGPEEEIANISPIVIEPGDSNIVAEWNKKPLYALHGISLKNNKNKITIQKIKCKSDSGIIYLKNEHTEKIQADLKVKGRSLTINHKTLGVEGDNTLVIENPYIQNLSHANAFYAVMEKYTKNIIPTFDVECRGNPNLLVGDMIRVKSSRDGVDELGILFRQKFEYDGALRCKMTLINAKLLGVS